MSEILTSTIDTIKSLPATLRALLLVILIAVAGFLAYIQLTATSGEVPASAVNKDISLDTVKAETKDGDASTGAINITQ